MQSIKNRKETVLDEHSSIVESCWEKDFEKTFEALETHHENSLHSLIKAFNGEIRHGSF